MLLREMLGRSVERFPTRPALIYHDQPITFAEMQVAVDRMAAGLRALGIGAGDRIAVLLPNCPPFAYAYYAATQIGAIVVPANPLLKPAELRYIWRDADVRLVVTVSPLLPSVQAAREGLDNLRHVVDVGPCQEDDAVSGYTTMGSVMELGARALVSDPTPWPALAENSCAVVIYTSGTTGHPKGAMLSHRNLTRNVEQCRAALVFNEEDRFLALIPLFHSFAGTVCLNAAMFQGGTSILLDSFAPNRTLEAIERHGATIFVGVPAIFSSLLQFPAERDYELGSLRMIVSGGAPLPAVILTAIEERFGVPVLEGDGPTECSPVTAVNPLDRERKILSIGLPVPGVEMAIFDDNDNPLPADTIGEIVVRGDNVMLGYLNQPEATAEVMTSGWYHTGDLGKIDSDGYVFIVDRKKDMIIVSGMNVYPREVEEVLLTHPAVADAAVIGLPSALRGEEVTAVIVRKPGAHVGARELVSLSREHLANFKVPRRVIFRETLPRGGTGKVVKRLLKKELELELPVA